MSSELKGRRHLNLWKFQRLDTTHELHPKNNNDYRNRFSVASNYTARGANLTRYSNSVIRIIDAQSGITPSSLIKSKSDQYTVLYFACFIHPSLQCDKKYQIP